jgi:hypothetical protein
MTKKKNPTKKVGVANPQVYDVVELIRDYTFTPFPGSDTFSATSAFSLHAGDTLLIEDPDYDFVYMTACDPEGLRRGTFRGYCASLVTFWELFRLVGKRKQLDEREYAGEFSVVDRQQPQAKPAVGQVVLATKRLLNGSCVSITVGALYSVIGRGSVISVAEHSACFNRYVSPDFTRCWSTKTEEFWEYFKPVELQHDCAFTPFPGIDVASALPIGDSLSSSRPKPSTRRFTKASSRPTGGSRRSRKL